MCSSFPLRSLLVAALLVLGCAHEVVWIGDQPAPTEPPAEPLPVTVAVGVRSFEAKGLAEGGVVQRFARGLRAARLFQGVMYPVPAGAQPQWDLQLLASDTASEPDSNRWKAALASALPPLAFVVWLESEYQLELEVLLLRDREIIRSYSVVAHIRHRYQTYADKRQMDLDGKEVVVGGATRDLLVAIARDLPSLSEELKRRHP